MEDKYFAIIIILVVVLYMVAAYSIDVAIAFLLVLIPILYYSLCGIQTPTTTGDSTRSPHEAADERTQASTHEEFRSTPISTYSEIDEDNEIFDMIDDVLNKNSKPSYLDTSLLSEVDSIYGGEFDREMAGGTGLSMNDQLFRHQRVQAKKRQRNAAVAYDPRNNIYHKIRDAKKEIGLPVHYGLSNYDYTYEPIYR